MFGTRAEKDLRALEDLVARTRPLNAFNQLSDNLKAPKMSAVLRSSHVCIDTCVLIHFAKHPKADTILDYFSSIHEGDLVVSAQSIQEYWNNHVFAIETVASGVSKKFTELEKEVKKVDPSWSNFSSEIDNLIARLKREYGHLHEPKLRAKLSSFADQLAKIATISEVPRSRFYAYAEQRKKLKTPPGFEDSGNGDFFIWLDFLYAIRQSKYETASHAILVTDDTKRDWSKGSVPHPVLAAEMELFTQLSFETWTLDKLSETIEGEVAGVGE